MNCPHCNTPNEPSNQFCVSCGRPLHVAARGELAVLSPREQLAMLTFRLLLALLGLWVLRAVVLGLSFVEELRIPDLDVTPASIINALIFLTAIFLLVYYGRDLSSLWLPAFPGYPELGALLTGLVYVIVLSAVYRGLVPIVAVYVKDPEPLMVTRLVLVLLVLIILTRAAILAYFGLMPWLTRLVSGLRILVPPAAPSIKAD